MMLSPKRILLGVSALAFASVVAAAPPPTTRAELVHKLLVDHFVPRVASFADAAPILAQSIDALCTSADLQHLEAARAAWTRTMLSWERAAAVLFGPLVARRSATRIDFWPARSRLIATAMNARPVTIGDLEMVGAPAKGIPAIEWLLWTPGEDEAIVTNPARCAYARLLAADVSHEAKELDTSFVQFAKTGLPDNVANDAFGGLLNLALSGLEELGVRKLEKPAEAGGGASFPRSLSEQTIPAWQADWSSLRDFLVGDAARGESDNLEAFLRAQNFSEAADKMRAAVDGTTVAFQQTTEATAPSARQLAKELVTLRTVMVDDVASKLDVAVQFGANDGD
jgi:predicted lipoprotein